MSRARSSDPQFDVEVDKREMPRSEARPFRGFRVPAALAALAAAIHRPERRFGRRYVFRLSRVLRKFRCTVMTRHRRLGRRGSRTRKWLPDATLHSLLSGDTSQCQRPKTRDEHDQQRDSGCPAIHVCDRCYVITLSLPRIKDKRANIRMAKIIPLPNSSKRIPNAQAESQSDNRELGTENWELISSSLLQFLSLISPRRSAPGNRQPIPCIDGRHRHGQIG